MGAKTVKKDDLIIETANVYVRLATANDLKNDFGTAVKIGQPFWVKSQFTGKFDNTPELMSDSTNLHEIKTWLDKGMLYVPAGYLELIDAGIKFSDNSQK